MPSQHEISPGDIYEREYIEDSEDENDHMEVDTKTKQHDQFQKEAAHGTDHIVEKHKELANEKEDTLMAMIKSQTALIESLQATIRDLQAEMRRMRQSEGDGNQSDSGL